jgi:pSer/pThr/pTyr-binding forkhead associated (FHA) protein
MFIENESSFVLGRSHESDVRISDISVSRTHARVFMKDNKFHMEDMGSKFGTLALAMGHVSISDLCHQSDLTTKSLIQIGRTLLYVEHGVGDVTHGADLLNFNLNSANLDYDYTQNIGQGHQNLYNNMNLDDDDMSDPKNNNENQDI